ncbi:uncharacterized protein LOC112215958 isoform X2 [Oncorhynchus tshawytscha]|uniref:uncharacterized protein LOC112215958 isoform X2 n=1 Tax=Oncorhynchus tshawytscha TaxID=74940 RepID=UPI000D0A4AF2|nr:uncharacterized protein LOC112215958 isoform X2 [Oncorhynchus tshawytscha]
MWFYVLVLTLACFDSVRSCTEEMLKNNPESTCNECPAGFHIEKGNSKCIKCIAGKEFTAIQNYDVACKRCKACDERASQMVVKSCEPKNDTECGCMKCYYPKKSRNGLQCFKCQTKDCSKYTECCSSCTITTTQRLPTLTPNPSITPVHYPLLTIGYVFVVVLVTILLFAGLLVLTKGGWMGHGCCETPEKDLQLPTRDTSANGQPNGPTSLCCQDGVSHPCHTPVASQRAQNPSTGDPGGALARQGVVRHHQGGASAALEGVPAPALCARPTSGACGSGAGPRLHGTAIPDAAAVEPGPGCRPGGCLLCSALHGPGQLCPPAAGQPGAAVSAPVDSPNQ